VWGAGYAVSAPQYGNDNYTQRQGTLDYVNILRPNMVLEINSSFNRNGQDRQAAGNGFNLTTIGLPSYYHNLPLQNCFPSITVAGMGTTFSIPDSANGNGGGFEGYCNGVTYLADHFADFLEAGNLTVTKGAHTLKMGGIFGVKGGATGRYLVANQSFAFTAGFTQGPNPQVASSTAGYGFASMLLGLANTGSINSAAPAPNINLQYWGAYFQDDWKINSKLTLNLGLRLRLRGSLDGAKQ